MYNFMYPFTFTLQVVINTNIFRQLLIVLPNFEFDIKKEVAWAMSNATSNRIDEEIKYKTFLYLHV
jgi:hypothetical protein